MTTLSKVNIIVQITDPDLQAEFEEAHKPYYKE